MKILKGILLFFVCFFSFVAKGQTTLSTDKDSISSVDYWSDLNYQIDREMALKNRVWIPKELKNNSTILGAYYSQAQGNLQPAQGASKVRDFGVYSEGKTTHKDTHFWGRFSYDRSLEDSTSLRHQTRWNNDAPVYFGSLRQNSYYRETYAIDAAVQHPVFQKKLPVTLAIAYRLGSHYSNNDPRGDIKDHDLNLTMGIGKSTKIVDYHINAIWGYGRERASVGYKNDKYTKNLEDPLYVNWLVNGYVNAKDHISDINYYDDKSRYGATINLLFKPNLRNAIYLNSSIVQEEQFFKRATSSTLTYDPLNKYKKEIFKIDVLWKWHINTNDDFRLVVNTDFSKGRGYKYSIQYVNYIYRSTHLEGAALYRKKQSTLKVFAVNNQFYKGDGQVGSSLDVSHLKYGAILAHNFSINKLNKLFGEIEVNQTKVLLNNMKMNPLNVYGFAAVTLYQDYLYYGASQQEIATKWNWMVQQHNGTSFGIYVKAAMQRRGDLPVIDAVVDDMPAKSRHTFAAGLTYLF